MGGRTLRHEAPWGSLAICHAGVDCDADTEESIGSIIVAIDPRHFALAAAACELIEIEYEVLPWVIEIRPSSDGVAIVPRSRRSTSPASFA